MDTKEDRLLALVGLLSGGLVIIIVLFTLTWLSDVRRIPPSYTNADTCLLIRNSAF